MEKDGIGWLVADATQIRTHLSSGAVNGVAGTAVPAKHRFAGGRVCRPREDRRAQSLVDLHAISRVHSSEQCAGTRLNPGVRVTREPVSPRGPQCGARDGPLFDGVEQDQRLWLAGHENGYHRLADLRRERLPAT